MSRDMHTSDIDHAQCSIIIYDDTIYYDSLHVHSDVYYA